MNLVVIDANELQTLIQTAITEALKTLVPAQSSATFSVAEAAEYMRISEPTLRRMIRENEIPSYNIRNRIFIRQMDIDQWVRKQLNDT